MPADADTAATAIPPGTLVRCVALGVAAGARASLGAAAPVLVPALAPGEDAPPGGAWRAVGRTAAGLALVGELVGDKLPRTPSRLDGGGPVARMVSGAHGAVLVARRRGVRLITALALAALAGAAGAAGGTWGGAAWRRLGVGHGPDWPFAVAEDAAALTLAVWAARPVRASGRS